MFPRYDRLADYYQPVDIVVAAHNFYLEQAADGGVFLLVAWALFIGTILFAALRTRALATRLSEPSLRLLAVGVISGIIGWLSRASSCTCPTSVRCWSLAAIAAAIDIRAAASWPPRQPTSRSCPGPPPAGPFWPPAWSALAVAAAVATLRHRRLRQHTVSDQRERPRRGDPTPR